MGLQKMHPGYPQQPKIAQTQSYQPTSGYYRAHTQQHDGYAPSDSQSIVSQEGNDSPFYPRQTADQTTQFAGNRRAQSPSHSNFSLNQNEFIQSPQPMHSQNQPSQHVEQLKGVTSASPTVRWTTPQINRVVDASALFEPPKCVGSDSLGQTATPPPSQPAREISSSRLMSLTSMLSGTDCRGPQLLQRPPHNASRFHSLSEHVEQPAPCIQGPFLGPRHPAAPDVGSLDVGTSLTSSPSINKSPPPTSSPPKSSLDFFGPIRNDDVEENTVDSTVVPKPVEVIPKPVNSMVVPKPVDSIVVPKPVADNISSSDPEDEQSSLELKSKSQSKSKPFVVGKQQSHTRGRAENLISQQTNRRRRKAIIKDLDEWRENCNDALEALSTKHDVTVKKLKKLLGMAPRLRKQRKISKNDALVHYKNEQVNGGKITLSFMLLVA